MKAKWRTRYNVYGFRAETLEIKYKDGWTRYINSKRLKKFREAVKFCSKFPFPMVIEKCYNVGKHKGKCREYIYTPRISKMNSLKERFYRYWLIDQQMNLNEARDCITFLMDDVCPNDTVLQEWLNDFKSNLK